MLIVNVRYIEACAANNLEIFDGRLLTKDRSMLKDALQKHAVPY